MSVFTKIISGEIPSYKVAETADFYAFLDINPNAPGHTLCVPKQETDKLFDLEEDVYTRLMQFSRNVALCLREEVSCKRLGMAVIGLEVPHVHVHLIPLRDMEDMRFSNKVSLENEEMQDIADRVNNRYNNTFN
ncbi:HIT family protein [Nonlabens marinus S1-08]|uniref:HIT family protein n=2 Tax=Nonlabens TaxID=363408 RepID=W8VPC7_9FLAO|nr:HIT family protein [Nonlabens marinus S1-08]